MTSGYADLRIAAEAMTLGAITLPEKPFSLDEQLRPLRKVLQKDAAVRAARDRTDDTRGRLAALTRKEREGLARVVAGLTNREIAERLGVSMRGVEDRRARLMRKAGVTTVAELVALATGW